MTALILAALVLTAPTPPPADDTLVRHGIASTYGPACVSHCLALPEHRWGRPGIAVVICGPATCIERTSTDAGPSKAMQRAGRVADLSLVDFETVCGCSWRIGLVDVSVRYGGDAGPIPTPPATDTMDDAGSSGISTNTMRVARLVARPSDGGRFAFRRV